MDDIAHVRTRPGMYNGGYNSRGLHHLLWELVDNAVDEAAAGFATAVRVSLHGDGSCTVADDGRGVPTAADGATGVPAVELVFGTLGGYDPVGVKAAGGFTGIGAAVVNFMSAALAVEIDRDGSRHEIRFERGVKVADLHACGAAKRTGTRVTFTPDPTLFHGLTFDHGTLLARLRELAFLNAGILTVLEDDRAGTRQGFRYTDGLAGRVRELAEDLAGARRPLTNVVRCTRTDPATRLKADVAIRFTDSDRAIVRTYVNHESTLGGTHLLGLKDGLSSAFAGVADPVPRRVDLFRGLTVIASVEMPEPNYCGSTRDRLGSVEVRAAVASVVADGFGRYLRENPGVAAALTARAWVAREARIRR